MKIFLIIIFIFWSAFAINAQKNVIGKKLIDTKLYSPNGESHNISEIKDKTIILTFVGESPTNDMLFLSDIYHHLYNEDCKDFVIITSSSEDYEIWSNKNNIDDLPWINLNDKKGKKGLLSDYGFQTTPALIIISPEGVIINRYEGYDIKLAQNLANRFSVPLATQKKVVKKPHYQKMGFFQPEHIEQIEYDNAETIITFTAFYNNKSKATDINSGPIYLRCDDESICSLIEKKKKSIKENGFITFTYKFEALPANVKRFDIINKMSKKTIIANVEIADETGTK